MHPIRIKAATLILLVQFALVGLQAALPEDGPLPSASSRMWLQDKACRPVVLRRKDPLEWGAVCRADASRLAMAAERMALGDCPLDLRLARFKDLTKTLVTVSGTGAGCQVSVEPLPTELRLALGLGVAINQASADELAQIPGIGPRLSLRIVEYRERHGTFSKSSDLLEVRGIGPAILQRLEPWLDFAPEFATE